MVVGTISLVLAVDIVHPGEVIDATAVTREIRDSTSVAAADDQRRRGVGSRRGIDASTNLNKNTHKNNILRV